jgi:predicted aldo/keto reductase-like oxidoreductase
MRDRYLPVIDELERMRDEGTVRTIGLSSHLNYELAFRIIDTGRLDELLISRGYFPKGMREIIWPRNLQWRDLCVARAHQLGMNIIGMKGLSNVLYGHFRVQEDGSFKLGPRTMVPDYPEDRIRRLPGAALRWAFSDHRFHLYIVGMSVPADVDEDVALCSGDLALTNDDRLLLAEFSTRLWDAEHVQGYETDIHTNYPAPPPPPELQGARLRTRVAEPHADDVWT